MAFNCVIVTPEKQLLDEKVSQVILPAHDGEMGILTGRAPILVKLGIGRLRADVITGGSRSYYVEGGVAQMKGEKLTIITDNAIPVDELDADAAKAELDAATARQVQDQAGATARARDIQRAQVKQRLAGAR